jgi:hypothetical protein
VHTIDNPVSYINRQVSRWMRRKDLFMRGVNVVETLRRGEPIETLVIYANADGIVPPGAAKSVQDVWGTPTVSLVEVGDETRWYAHADMFVGQDAAADVFEPLRCWLDARLQPKHRASA